MAQAVRVMGANTVKDLSEFYGHVMNSEARISVSHSTPLQQGQPLV